MYCINFRQLYKNPQIFYLTDLNLSESLYNTLSMFIRLIKAHKVYDQSLSSLKTQVHWQKQRTRPYSTSKKDMTLLRKPYCVIMPHDLTPHAQHMRHGSWGALAQAGSEPSGEGAPSQAIRRGGQGFAWPFATLRALGSLFLTYAKHTHYIALLVGQWTAYAVICWAKRFSRHKWQGLSGASELLDCCRRSDVTSNFRWRHRIVRPLFPFNLHRTYALKKNPRRDIDWNSMIGYRSDVTWRHIKF